MTDSIGTGIETVDRPLVLVVDDVFENRSSVQRRLARLGYDCQGAESGMEALDMLLTLSPTVILLDYMMPEMSGLTVLKRLRASPLHAHTPIIMLTARTDSEAVVESLSEGADDYVHKPIDFAVLKARIDAHIERHRARRRLIGANERMEGRVAARAIELSEVREMLSDQIARNQARDRREGGAIPDAAGLETLATALEWIETLSAPRTSQLADEVGELRRSMEMIWSYASRARKVVASFSVESDR